MLRFWPLAVIGLCACSGPEFKQQRLQDGSLQIQCDLAMDECMRQAQDLCDNQRFRILEGTSETRISDAPPFERASRTSRLHLKCTNAGAEPLLSLDRPPAPSLQPLPPTSACTLGETRACVGPGACKGGQACLPDGKGFGPCDCGPAAPVTPATSEPAPAAPPNEPNADGTTVAPIAPRRP